MNSQFEGVQVEILDRGEPDPCSLPDGLFWPGDRVEGDVGPKLSQDLYLKAYRTEKSLARV